MTYCAGHLRHPLVLIEQTAKENPLWGIERIRGELLKLAIGISKHSVQRYMPKVRRKSNQN